MQARWIAATTGAAVLTLFAGSVPAQGHATATTAVSHSHHAAHRHKFRITKVKVPTDLYANGPDRNITIYWKGHATFPVRAVTKPRSCPAGYECDSVHHTFTERAHPLVWKKVAHCQGTVPPGFTFKYWLWLVDANGRKAARVKINTACHQGPQ